MRQTSVMHVVGDEQRIAMNRNALREQRIDALLCSRPTHVLLSSGYWPVAGYTIVILTREATTILAPSDEIDRARAASWADEFLSYELGSLDELNSTMAAIEDPLNRLLDALHLSRARIGIARGPWVQPAPYAALSGFGEALVELLRRIAPHAHLESADEMLETLRRIKSDREIEQIRRACAIAQRAFLESRELIHVGMTEQELAGLMRAKLLECNDVDDHCDGFAYCMSGPNAADANRFFQETRQRRLQSGDLVLAHCNSHRNGFWTDISRTYALAPNQDRTIAMYEAVFAARQAALDAIHPGVRAADVDAAARAVMHQHGFGEAFKTPLGHGVGFAAIDHHARPRLHPKSPDVLWPGMVFNIEPGIYLDGECGMRHCDVVALRSSGAEVLSDFQNDVSELHAANKSSTVSL